MEWNFAFDWKLFSIKKKSMHKKFMGPESIFSLKDYLSLTINFQDNC